MDLAGAITPPALDRGQDEIRLLFEDIRAAFFDRVEGAFCRRDDDAAGTRACHERNGFDDTQVAFKVRNCFDFFG